MTEEEVKPPVAINKAVTTSSTHLGHTWATFSTLRFDDRVPLQWSQSCCQDPPAGMRGHTGPMLTCVLEKRKTNQVVTTSLVISHSVTSQGISHSDITRRGQWNSMENDSFRKYLKPGVAKHG